MAQPVSVRTPSTTLVVSSAMDDAPQNSPEVEEAQDATSPSAFAVQSLNHMVSEIANDRQGRHSRSSSDGTSHIQEIPLEDLSTKKSSLQAPSASDLHNRRRRSPSSDVIRDRSGSRSPLRRTRHSSGPTTRSASPLAAKEKLSAGPRTASPKRNRAGSFPISKGSPKTSQTSLTSSPKNSPPRAERSISDPEQHVKTGPKTLTPAHAPALSLVPSIDSDHTLANSGIGSPKLVPPAEPERKRKVSDSSSVDSMNSSSSALTSPEQQQQQQEHKNNEEKPKRRLSFRPEQKGAATLDTNQATANQVEVANGTQESATEQLTKLAQLVTERFSVSDQESELELKYQTDDYKCDS